MISLNVPAATELDAALKEHGRIMHDATSINITNGAAGKFGDVEWVDAKASSISEMVSKLAFELEGKMDASTATALLTGLVAATDRFKNPATTPDAMVLAAKLMGAGADQQLVVQNVQGEVVFDGEAAGAKNVVVPEADSDAVSESDVDSGSGSDEPRDASHLSIDHGEGNEAEAPVEMDAEKPVLENSENESSEVQEQGSDAEASAEQSSANLTPEISNLGQEAGATNSGAEEDPVKAAMASALNPMGAPVASAASTVAGVDVAVAPENANGYAGGSMADQILNNLEKNESNVGATDYGKMIDEALDEPLPGEGGSQVGQVGAAGVQVNTQDVDKVDVPQGNPMSGVIGPSASSANDEEEAMNIIKAAQEEANAPLPGVTPGGELPKIIPGGGMTIDEQPVGMGDASVGAGNPPAGMTLEPNPMPMPGQDTLPPPVLPTPDFGAMPPSDTVVPGGMEMPGAGASVQSMMPVENTIPVPEPVAMPNVMVQPDMNAGVIAAGLPQVPEAPAVPETPADPSAFKIPGIHT